MHFRLILLLLFFLAPAGFAATGSDLILGQWQAEEGDHRIEIMRRSGPDGDVFVGRLVWLAHPTKLPNGTNALGYEHLTGFGSDGERAWRGGKILNPEDGKTYDATIRLESDDVLLIRGSTKLIGIIPVSRTQRYRRWTRTAQPSS